jgi:hypothetical protein
MAEQLKTLAKEHNIGQADVIEHLLAYKFKSTQEKKK